MPDDLIRIQPAPGRRREFAAWAVTQTPRLRTVSHTEFAVPAPLYTAMPEELLVGALIDGHPYRPVDDDQLPPGEHQTEGMAAIGAVDGREPTADEVAAAHNGTDTDRAEWLATASGETSQEPAAVGQETVAPGQAQAEPVVCPVDGCGREFGSGRALRAHRRQAHSKTTTQSGS